MNQAETAELADAGKPMSEITADRIISHIVSAGLEKGAKLGSERYLCSMLNVGRSTLREAVRMLASRNILTVRHGSGIYISEKLGIPDDPLGFTFVRDKRKLVLDLIEFRRLVEPPVCAMAAVNVTDEEIAELKEIEDEVERLILSGMMHQQADARFHSKISVISGNSVMPKIEPIIFQSIGLFIDMTGSILKQETITDHRSLIMALEAHDPVRASDAMLLHIMHNREVIERQEMAQHSKAS